MEADGDGGVLVVDDLDALAHGLLAEEVDQAVGHGAEGHTLHAEAVCGGVPGNVGKNGVTDGNGAFLSLQFYHKITSFQRSC
jgi:hypothetical protein